jgi:hypothetical protein
MEFWGNDMRSDALSMVKYCLDKAAECSRHAEQSTDASRKESWLEMAGLWFYLARSYQSEYRADSFPSTP